MVDMFHQLEMARVGAQFAAWASDTDDPQRERAAAMAASYSAEAANHLTADNIQTHGGVGFTWANDAHFLFKRAKQNEVLMGGISHERRRLASHAGRVGLTAPAVATWELRPVPADLARRYRERGCLGRPVARSLPDRLPAGRPGAPDPDLVAHQPPHRHGRRGLPRTPAGWPGGCGISASAPATWWPSSCPTGWRRPPPSTPAPCSAWSWYRSSTSTGPRRWASSCAQSGARALIQVGRIGQRDYLGDLATLREGLGQLEHVVVVRGRAAAG